jgi:homoserine dehydrogenase
MSNLVPFRLGIAGAGTVGGAVVRLLLERGDTLAQRAGRPLVITAIATRSPEKLKDLSLQNIHVLTNPLDLASLPDVDAVVEVIGGAEGTAKSLVETSLKAGKHVITANKALLAHHGHDLAVLAENNKVNLTFEAAVAGGVPILKALREGAVANTIFRIFGILNGTCNYILTKSQKTGLSFADILKEAQHLGYAEADPAADVDGLDTGHKLSILASLAFSSRISFEHVRISGIRALEPIDHHYAAELGYAVKLLGYAEHRNGTILQRVSPFFVPLSLAIGHVEDVFNAVVLEGDAVGQIMIQGRGAGGMPTASAVLADIVDIASGRSASPFGIKTSLLHPSSQSPDFHSEFYLRLSVAEKPGIVAAVASILAENSISIKTLQQRSNDDAATVPLLLTTHTIPESAVDKALAAIINAKLTASPPLAIPLLTE